MSSLSLLLFSVLILVCSELSPLCTIIFLVLVFVFLLVSLAISYYRTSLLRSLVFLLFLVVGCFMSTSSLLVFFIMYELRLYPVLLLVVLFGYQPEKINSSLLLFLYTVVCSAPLLFFSVTFSGFLFCSLSTLSSWASLLVCLSFMVKAPVYTLHS